MKMYFHPTGLQTTTQNHFSHHHHKYIHQEYIHHHIIPPTTITSPSSLFTYNINEDFEEPAVVVVKAPLLLIADLFGMNILLVDCNEIEVIDTFCMYTESEQRRRTQTLRGSSRSMSWSYRHSTLTRRTPDPRSWEKAKTKLLRAPCVSLRLSLYMGKENKRESMLCNVSTYSELWCCPRCWPRRRPLFCLPRPPPPPRWCWWPWCSLCWPPS